MSHPVPEIVEPSAAPPAVPLDRRFHLEGPATLYAMTVERLLRGRRLLVLGLFFLLPTGTPLLARRYNPNYDPEKMEIALLFYMIPQALVPLTALVLASGMVQDEVEDQTWTYLVIRPL